MRTAPPPDVEGMISGGQVRRRRRNAAMLGGGLLAVVLVGVGIYGATQLTGDSETTPPVVSEPTVSPSAPQNYDLAGDSLEPGTYRKVVGADQNGGKLEADLTFGSPGWEAGDHPVLSVGGDWGGATVYQAERLAGSDYCSLDQNDQWETTSLPAADTSSALARQLAQLPSSTVIQPITSTQAFELDALHLRLRINDTCGSAVYHLADTSLGGGHGVTYTRPGESPDVIIDFLVVDLDGTPIVAEYWHHPDADAELVAEVTGVRDSIAFVPSDG